MVVELETWQEQLFCNLVSGSGCAEQSDWQENVSVFIFRTTDHFSTLSNLEKPTGGCFQSKL